MKILCLEDFKFESEKIKNKKTYRDLEGTVRAYFFNKPIDRMMSGVRLNNSNDVPYIKKRLSGSGGYRLYFLLLVKDERLVLMFIHPKTGSMGSSNITD